MSLSNRHDAALIRQFELMSQQQKIVNKLLIWPHWPIKLRTSSSCEEGYNRDLSVVTKRFEGKNNMVEKLIGVRVQ